MTRHSRNLPWLVLPCALAAAALMHQPTQAAGPLVLLVKQAVQKMVVSFVEDRIADGIRASFGPCKQDLANDAIESSRAVTRLIVPTGPSVLGAAAGGLPGAAQAAQSVRESVGAAGALGPGATRVIELAQTKDRIEQSVGKDAAAIVARSHDLLQGSVASHSSDQLSAAGEIQGAMAQMQAMMNAPPLTPAESIELSQMLERVGKVAEAVHPGTPACSAADYQRQFARVTVAGADPRMGGMVSSMTAGMLRMMHTSFKKMSQETAETEALFARMTPQDRVDYVESTVADLKDAPPLARRAMMAMLDAGLVAAPDDVRAALKKRLAE